MYGRVYWILNGSIIQKAIQDFTVDMVQIDGVKFAVTKVTKRVKGVQVLSLSTCLSQCHCGPNMWRSIWTSVSQGGGGIGVANIDCWGNTLQIPTPNYLKYSEVAYFAALREIAREKE